MTPAEIGAAVKKARKAHNLRQDELAGAAGVGLRLVVDLEAGKATLQIGKAVRVIEALGLRLEIVPRSGGGA